MMDLLHKILLGIHIPFGVISLILFWIPVGVRKGSPLHRKVGKYYFMAMTGVLITAVLLSIVNTILGHYLAALYLGYLAIITSYPLWYSAEILKQKKTWSNKYFLIRRSFLLATVVAGTALLVIGIFMFQFKGMGTMMVFFGLIGAISIKDLMISKEKAMQQETQMKMHIQGTIISGIAAYTAFFAFGGSRILLDVLQMNPQWMAVPWIAPTVMGVLYMRFMQRSNWIS